MTVVARLSVNQYPLLIGDLLLSGEEEEGAPVIHVPTVGPHTGVFPSGAGFSISDLRQKITVVGDNLAVAWAGNRLAAQSIIKEIIEINSTSSFTFNELAKYLENLPPVEINRQVSFVGWVKEGGRVRGFGFRSSEYESDKFGKVGLCGTGAEDVKEYLEDFPEITQGEKDNPLWKAYSTGLLLSGFLLRVEMATHSSLLQYYGGGYELLSLQGGKFQKLDDITFIFWEAHVNGKRVTFTLQPRMFKYSYQGDALVISTATLDDLNGGRVGVAVRRTINVVSPIYREISTEEARTYVIPDMNSKIICNYFLLSLPNNVRQVFARVHLTHGRNPLLRFTEREGIFEAIFDQEQMSEITQELGTHYDSVA